MIKNIIILIVCGILNTASTQTLDHITPIQNSPASCNSQWDDLLPALKLLKSTQGIKKERLLNVVKIIKFLLSEEKEKKKCDKILEDIKCTNEFQVPDMTDFESILEERLGPIEQAMDGNVCFTNDIDLKKELPNNNSEELNKVLAKISAALDKVKENNEGLASSTPSSIMPMFKSGINGCKNDFIQPLFETTHQVGKSQKAEIGSKSKKIMFNIPCQRAADILEETSNFIIPKDAYCGLPNNINLDSILKNPKLKSDNLPFQTVPNSISCVDSDDSMAILFKPKKISLMQVYGNLLKKITITVLVPYHVSKITS